MLCINLEGKKGIPLPHGDFLPQIGVGSGTPSMDQFMSFYSYFILFICLLIQHVYFSAFECFVKCIFVFLNLLPSPQTSNLFCRRQQHQHSCRPYGLHKTVSIEILIGLASLHFTTVSKQLTDNMKALTSDRTI